ncbi:MFS transporter [Sphingomonas sp.]|uniref:MFS transporter n=1 Tax=Sphingomonas sp. TaxID=28214 RepID=UPI003B3BD5FE
MAATIAAPPEGKRSSTRLVIVASTLGTVFEWYDFFVYGTLATIIGQHFFPAGNSAVSLLITLATFGVGFGMRPIGAVLFGILGDRLGRKYTFLVTVALMGGATAGVGLLPTYASIGLAAPILLVVLRVAQGLALGGEYGGAAIYVAEHAPRGRRGLYTGFIQAGVAGGFLLSLAVVLAANTFVEKEAWAEWGWRIPFLFSLVLLAISLWVRMKLHESPVFKAMQAENKVARNPLKESFDSWAKWRRILVVLFGIAAGLTVIFYTAHFQSLYFIQSAVRIDDTPARLIVGASATLSILWYVLFGWLSDKIGRKPPIIAGYILTLILIFPLFHWMAAAGNPGLAAAIERAPVVVRGSDCSFDPFATQGQATPCGRVLDALTTRGVAYRAVVSNQAEPQVTIGSRVLPAADDATIAAGLADAGYPVGKVTPPLRAALQVGAAIVLIGILSGMTYGPVAACLVELFPARVRYTSMSIPYHIGSGYFGGFLPFINQYIVARTGDPFAGIWYMVAVTVLALLVVGFGLPETSGKKLE